jgi:hypothetical protein
MISRIVIPSQERIVTEPKRVRQSLVSVAVHFAFELKVFKSCCRIVAPTAIPDSLVAGSQTMAPGKLIFFRKLEPDGLSGCRV